MFGAAKPTSKGMPKAAGKRLAIAAAAAVTMSLVQRQMASKATSGAHTATAKEEAGSSAPDSGSDGGGDHSDAGAGAAEADEGEAGGGAD